MRLEFFQREEERFDKIASQTGIEITRMEIGEKIKMLARIDKLGIEPENLTKETVLSINTIANECRTIA